MNNYINKRPPKIIMRLKDFLTETKYKLGEISAENKRKRLLRKQIIDSLTIDEAEKVYTSYINKDLFDEVNEFGTIKKRRKNIKQLKFQIKLNVKDEHILYCVPRIKKFLED